MIRNSGFIRGQTGAFAHKAFARPLIGSRTEGSRMSALNLFCSPSAGCTRVLTEKSNRRSVIVRGLQGCTIIAYEPYCVGRGA